MPTYEYQCPEGHEFELFQKMSEKPRAKCPVCGKTAVRQISGGAGLVFKGSGFYITDYGKDGKGPRKDPSEKSDSGGCQGSQARSRVQVRAPPRSRRAKPAAKPEAKSAKHPPSKSRGKAAPE